MEGIQGWSVINKALFPAPNPSYTYSSFPNQLLWIPHSPVSSLHNYFPSLFIQSSHRSVPVLLYLHGNGADLGHSYSTLSIYSQYWKVHVFAVEYPGYGICGGFPSEQGCYQAAQAAYDFLVNLLHFKSSQIVIFGRSIGSGPAIALAAQICEQYELGKCELPGGLIVQSPYLSIKTLAKSLVGNIAKLITDRFENIKKISSVKWIPVLFIHGDQDELIPYHHSEKLYELCGSEKKIIFLAEGADHNSFDDNEHIYKPIKRFLIENKLTKVKETNYCGEGVLEVVFYKLGIKSGEQEEEEEEEEEGEEEWRDLVLKYFVCPNEKEQGNIEKGGIWNTITKSVIVSTQVSAAMLEGSAALMTKDDTKRHDKQNI